MDKNEQLSKIEELKVAMREKDYELADKLGKDLYGELAGRKQLFKRFDL